MNADELPPDLAAIEERTRRPTPKGPSYPPDGVPETVEERAGREVQRQWMREWKEDRDDLRRLLFEVAELRYRMLLKV